MNLQLKIRSVIQIIFLLMTDPAAYSQQPLHAINGSAIPGKGIITDTIKCRKNTDFSYALYLPEGYSDKLKWPVIFVFDPGARGSVAVNCFKQAAEHYGYIVAGSNNSRNGSLSNSIASADYMFDDVENRFRIDLKRMYTAGFSGGSRIAALLALTTHRFAGVIGCGAGFPNDIELLPGASDSFVYIGIVGKKDMNYLEMSDLEQELNSHKMVARLITTDAGHSWPDPEILDVAVSWLELQAMIKGIIPMRMTFIDRQFKDQREDAEKLGMNGKWFEAAGQYRYLLRDFPDQPGINQYRARLDSIEKTNDFRKDERSWNSIRTKEISLRKTFMTSMYEAFTAETFTDTLQVWWKREISSLKRIEKSQDTERKYMSMRLLNLLTILTMEEGRNSLNIKDYHKAVVAYRIWTILQTDNVNSFYNLSRAYAFQNLKNESLASLAMAIKTGFKNRSVVEKDPAFTNFKDDRNFKILLNRIQ